MENKSIIFKRKYNTKKIASIFNVSRQHIGDIINYKKRIHTNTK